MLLGEFLCIVTKRESFPMLQHVVETETSCAQCGGDVEIEHSNEGQHDRLRAFIALAHGGRESTPTGRGPLIDLFLVASACSAGDQCTAERGGVESEQTGLIH